MRSYHTDDFGSSKNPVKLLLLKSPVASMLLNPWMWFNFYPTRALCSISRDYHVSIWNFLLFWPFLSHSTALFIVFLILRLLHSFPCFSSSPFYLIVISFLSISSFTPSTVFFNNLTHKHIFNCSKIHPSSGLCWPPNNWTFSHVYPQTLKTY